MGKRRSNGRSEVAPLLLKGAGIQQFARIKSERIIIVSRIVLAAGGLIATYLDPAQPSAGPVGYAFLGGYFVFSLLILAKYSRPLRGALAVVAHAVELALICLIIIYTEGPSSPFFVYFTFVLLVAALRWQAFGALVTGAVLASVLVAMTASEFLVNFGQADVERLIVRNIYLVVASALIAFFGDQFGRYGKQVERLRLAQELHDGVLQTLSAVGLRLHGAAAKSSGEQRERIEQIAQILRSEQRHLRDFVEQSRGGASAETGPCTVKNSELKSFADRLKLLWDCDVALTLRPTDISVNPAIVSELKFIIAEGVANAVTHGQAKHIAILIRQDAKAIALQIKDDGTGLPDGQPHRDRIYQPENEIGPRSIRDRVAQLRGSLRVTSTARGVELKIELPALARA